VNVRNAQVTFSAELVLTEDDELELDDRTLRAALDDEEWVS
jgi:hypothetical protein